MTKQGTRDLLLWIGVLSGPVFWLFSFQAKLSWVPLACAAQSKLILLLFSLSAIVLTATAGFFSWRQWKELGHQQPGAADDILARSRSLAVGGMVFSLGFCMVIVAQAIPDMILGVCQ